MRYEKYFFAFLITATLTFAWPTKAADLVVGTLKMACFPQTAESLIDELTKTHGEQPVGRGIVDGGEGLFYVLSNQETGTWTIVGYDTNKTMSCMISNGSDWETLKPPKLPKKSAPPKATSPETQHISL